MELSKDIRVTNVFTSSTLVLFSCKTTNLSFSDTTKFDFANVTLGTIK